MVKERYLLQFLLLEDSISVTSSKVLISCAVLEIPFAGRLDKCNELNILSVSVDLFLILLALLSSLY